MPAKTTLITAGTHGVQEVGLRMQESDGFFGKLSFEFVHACVADLSVFSEARING